MEQPRVATSKVPLSRELMSKWEFNLIEEVTTSTLMGKVSNYTEKDPIVYILKSQKGYYHLLTPDWKDINDSNRPLRIESPGWAFENFRSRQDKANFLKAQEIIKTQAKELKVQ